MYCTRDIFTVNLRESFWSVREKNCFVQKWFDPRNSCLDARVRHAVCACRVLLLRAELFYSCRDAASAVDPLLECVTLCKRHHFAHISSLATLHLAFVQVTAHFVYYSATQSELVVTAGIALFISVLFNCRVEAPTSLWLCHSALGSDVILVTAADTVLWHLHVLLSPICPHCCCVLCRACAVPAGPAASGAAAAGDDTARRRLRRLALRPRTRAPARRPLHRRHVDAATQRGVAHVRFVH